MSERIISKRTFNRLTVGEDDTMTINTDRGEFITSATLNVQRSDSGNITYAMLDRLIHKGPDDIELVHAPRSAHGEGHFYYLSGCLVTEMELLPASDPRIRELAPRHWHVS